MPYTRQSKLVDEIVFVYVCMCGCVCRIFGKQTTDEKQQVGMQLPEKQKNRERQPMRDSHFGIVKFITRHIAGTLSSGGADVVRVILLMMAVFFSLPCGIDG